MIKSSIKLEHFVSTFFNSHEEYKVFLDYKLFNYMLSRNNQCDVIGITPNKVYCVECKNFSTTISGSTHDKFWSFYSSGKKGKVVNPYLKNSDRVRLMRCYFYRYRKVPVEMESVIVVPDHCRIVNNTGNIYNFSDFKIKVKNDNMQSPTLNVDGVFKFLDSIKSN